MPQPSRNRKILLVVVALLDVAVIAAVFYRLGQDTPSTTPSPTATPTTHLRVLAIPSTGIAVDWILHLWAAAGPRPSR